MKNRKWIEIGLIILVIVCIIILIGKNMGWFSEQLDKEQKGASNQSEETVKNGDNEKYPIDVPYKWQEEIDAYNKIDAKISIPDIIRTDGFLEASAKKMAPNQDEILPFLEDYYKPYLSNEYEDSTLYRGADELYLYLLKDKYKDIIISSKFGNYISMAYRDNPGTDDYNRELYPVEEDLEGFSVEECEEKVKNICEKLGIKSEVQIIYRSLDYRIMEEQATELHMDGSSTKPDYKWKIADSSYHCTISQLCNEVPIIQNYIVESYGDILNYGDFTCIINKERIVNLFFSNIYEIKYEKKYVELLSFESILQKYKEIAGLTIQKSNTLVTDITLRVIAVNRQDGNYDLVPIWIFYGNDTLKDGEETYFSPYAIIINGITGEQI